MIRILSFLVIWIQMHLLRESLCLGKFGRWKDLACKALVDPDRSGYSSLSIGRHGVQVRLDLSSL